MIPGLDGLRAIAYLLIFFFHAKYLELGWIGVQFFFVLSGFLITGILLDMKEKLPARNYFLKFYGRRFLRIFPLYYFYLAAMGLLIAWLISNNYRVGWLELFNKQVGYAIFYVYNFFSATIHKTDTYFLTHFWSLSVEEQFYIFWPLIILLTPEKFRKGLFLAFITFGPIFRIAFYFVHASGRLGILHPSVSDALYPIPFTHIDAFALGAYISRYAIPKAKGQFLLLLGAVPIAGIAAQYLTTGSVGAISAFGYPILMPNGFQFVWGYSLLNYFFAIVVQLVVRNGMFNRLLEWAPLRYLGKISYGLYVYHLPVIWFAPEIKSLGLDADILKPVATVVAFFATLLIASISYRFMEKPLLNLKDRFFPVKPNDA